MAVISHLIAKWFSNISPELKKLADEGKILTTEHDRNLLNRMNLYELVDKNTTIIPTGSTTEQMMVIIGRGTKNAFAIVNPDQVLHGVMTLDDIRPFLFTKEREHLLKMKKMIKAPLAVIYPKDEMPETIRKFDDTGTWHLPVVDQQNRFVGFLSKSSILACYRQLLKEYS